MVNEIPFAEIQFLKAQPEYTPGYQNNIEFPASQCMSLQCPKDDNLHSNMS